MEREKTETSWEARYKNGLVGTQYPLDIVVSFVFTHFPSQKDGPKKRVLDFGCGVGNHIPFLLERGFDVFAVDSSKTAIRRVKLLMKEEGDQWLDEHVVQNIEETLPFDDDQFDFVLDRSALGQNGAAEIPVIVSEIHRVLTPGGVYFGVNFSDHHPSIQYGKRRGRGDFSDFTGGKFQEIGGRHFFSVSEILDLFSKFKIEDIRLMENRSLLGKGSSAEYIVTAIKM